MEQERPASISLQLVVLTLSRFVLNTGLRFVYPYSPALARGLGVPLGSIYYLITLRNMTGFLSPLFGPLSERYGRRAVLMLGMSIFGLGALLVALFPTYWFLGFFLCGTGLAKALYDPAMQAYVGDEVPYAQRGRAIAITEYSWATSLLVGVPLVGLLIQRQGWQAPFLWLGVGSIIAVVALWGAIGRSAAGSSTTDTLAKIVPLLHEYHVVLYAALYITLFFTANEMLFIVFGAWMEDSFALSLTSLGVAAAVIGGAELAGETFAGWSVDRYGKRKVIILTGSLTAVCNLLLPFASSTLAGALVTLFVLFLAFEITVVGGIPLLTELVPGSRAVVMSIIFAAMFTGRTLGSLLGPLIWANLGFTLSGVVWAAISGAAILVLVRWVHE